MAADADSLLRDAVLLERAGRVAEAIAVYERLLARWPDRPDTWYNLALLQRKARRYESALASYQQALNRGVSQPEEVHLNRGVIYADYLRRDAAAAAELATALEFNPRYVPALLNLANLDEDFGRRDEARARYERILEIDPGCHLALARLAGLAAVSSPDDPLITRLRGAIERAETSPADRASLGFALGRLLDSCGAYEPAFDAYQAANRASRASAGPGGPRYDRQRQERFVDALIAAFPQVRNDVVTPAVAGGKTDLRLRHVPVGLDPDRADARGAPSRGRGRRGRHPAGPGTERARALSRVDAAGVAAGALANMAAPLPAVPVGPLSRCGIRHRQAAGQFPEHRPDQDAVSGRAHRAYDAERARQLPLDLLPAPRPRMSYALDLLDIGHYYREYRRLMAHWQALYGPDILDFDYDSLRSRSRTRCRSAARVLRPGGGPQLPAGQRTDRRRQDGERVAGASSLSHQRSVGRWRNYARQLAALRADLGDLVDEAP